MPKNQHDHIAIDCNDKTPFIYETVFLVFKRFFETTFGRVPAVLVEACLGFTHARKTASARFEAVVNRTEPMVCSFRAVLINSLEKIPDHQDFHLACIKSP